MIAAIGSVAFNARHRIGRIPNDLDVVATYDDFVEWAHLLYDEKLLALYPISGGAKMYAKTDRRIIECEIAWHGSSAETLLNLILEDKDTYVKFDMPCASIDILYMLKMSHRYLKDSKHFLKTMRDIQLLRKFGAKIRQEHEEFYQRRMKDTYTYSHPKLNQSKKNFFNDTVPYVYDHDSLHLAVMRLHKPAYSFFKKDEAEVAVSKEKFMDCSQHIKLLSVLEEVEVLALERSQIPYPETDRRKSFDMAHMKIVTSISSGWWREWAWEHYYDVQEMYDGSYVDVFQEALYNGRIVKVSGEENGV